MSRFEAEASRLRVLASNPNVRVRFTKHAEKERQNDEIARIDILNMLTRCRATLVEDDKNDETWRAEGTDSDGRGIAAVVVAYEEAIIVKVITCFALRKQR